jgi:hypothetical protein
VICFSLDNGSLQLWKTTKSVKVEHIRLQTYQDPGETQTDRKGTSARLWLPTIHC